jgi:hypothetical protein
MIDRLISMFTKSTIYIPAKLTALATQKNILLTKTEDMPVFYISMNAKDTNELNPARRITISPIIR